jgi:hypothetical protein
MDTMRYAVLLKARNDLVRRSARLRPVPEGSAIMDNQEFQESLDILDPDLPCAARMPLQAFIAYRRGMWHIGNTASFFTRGGDRPEYNCWYSGRC